MRRITEANAAGLTAARKWWPVGRARDLGARRAGTSRRSPPRTTARRAGHAPTSPWCRPDCSPARSARSTTGPAHRNADGRTTSTSAHCDGPANQARACPKTAPPRGETPRSPTESKLRSCVVSGDHAGWRAARRVIISAAAPARTLNPASGAVSRREGYAPPAPEPRRGANTAPSRPGNDRRPLDAVHRLAHDGASTESCISPAAHAAGGYPVWPASTAARRMIQVASGYCFRPRLSPLAIPGIRRNLPRGLPLKSARRLLI